MFFILLALPNKFRSIPPLLVKMLKHKKNADACVASQWQAMKQNGHRLLNTVIDVPSGSSLTTALGQAKPGDLLSCRIVGDDSCKHLAFHRGEKLITLASVPWQ